MAQLIDRATLEMELNRVLEQARSACAVNGDQSNECAAAWDIVEELQAALSHRKTAQKSSLEIYCDQNPGAAECRIYDV
ncbi:MAG TPA: Calvin cycle protein CP12 [Leptolyngbyaceae cyanobacterium M33_DOE_097]|uniref:CP12 domain-containing protein n=1 Tax=Oscillatoriales cyanobacterium SpSt-418 TaxID=2282169 RepID=A0A7C3PHL5_9CYAN|nr:Calvin cycle protein CP12 [Leptolyngbyaceae cyanobacterium M33_DOE_097]